MARRELVIRLDENLIGAVAKTAASDRVSSDAIIEEALRRYFGLRGLAVLADLAESSEVGDRLSDEEAMALAVAEVRAYRVQRRAAG